MYNFSKEQRMLPTIDSPDDEHEVARNMLRIEIHSFSSLPYDRSKASSKSSSPYSAI
jgi:hypothetical protein